MAGENADDSSSNSKWVSPVQQNNPLESSNTGTSDPNPITVVPKSYSKLLGGSPHKKFPLVTSKLAITGDATQKSGQLRQMTLHESSQRKVADPNAPHNDILSAQASEPADGCF